MSASERDVRRTAAPRQVSMRDLLASCAAARAVSTPPPPPRIGRDVKARPDAA
ncbi:hypothetical protein V2W30_16085 [Streptomyces sp. Q6]|uniref:Uncharacterized protein n=1 Tax=Streptomyces citrinus TaxID=3118173 RepID=A0ACD5AC47_9ACTN